MHEWILLSVQSLHTRYWSRPSIGHLNRYTVYPFLEKMEQSSTWIPVKKTVISSVTSGWLTEAARSCVEKDSEVAHIFMTSPAAHNFSSYHTLWALCFLVEYGWKDHAMESPPFWWSCSGCGKPEGKETPALVVTHNNSGDGESDR